MSEVSPTRPTKPGNSRPALRADERRDWIERGFFVRPCVFDPAAIAAFRRAADRVEARLAEMAETGRHYRIDGHPFHDVGEMTIQYEGDEARRRVRIAEPVHHLDPDFESLIDDSRIVTPMCELVASPRVALFTDKLNFKGAGGAAFGWHQDSPYWLCLGSRVANCPNVMLALDDADDDNGCFRVIEGSHRQGVLRGRSGEAALDPLFTHPDAFDPGDERAVALRAGSLVFFHAHLVHGSRRNPSASKRRALVLTYQASDYPMFKRAGIRNAGPRSTRGNPN